MLFNSFAFLGFLPLFTLAYWSTHGRARLWVCLIASYVFYAWWDARFLLLVLASTVLDYVLGIAIDARAEPAARHRLMTLSVVANLGFLGFFKYSNFLLDSGAALLAGLGFRFATAPLHIILPVGISFYVFKTMSYTIDVYRGEQGAERDLLRFATFVAFFPELVAGPIVRASRLLPQLRHDHRFDGERLLSGLQLILTGYVLKVVIADSLAPLVDQCFGQPAAHNALSLLIGVYFYAFQIYCDFSGYSAIAIGVARTLGFDFGINFDRPYFSRSFSEFWTRWHISLSSWLRDYLYISLGGNRGGRWPTCRNLMLTMLLGGLWHGANWTFVMWGGLHGCYLVVQRLVGGPADHLIRRCRVPSALWNAFLVLLVFHLTCLGWILFRSKSLDVALEIIRRIAVEGSWSFDGVRHKFLIVKGGLLIAGFVAAEGLSFVAPAWPRPSQRPVVRLVFAAACLWCIALLGTFSGNNFIYFQF